MRRKRKASKCAKAKELLRKLLAIAVDILKALLIRLIIKKLLGL